MCARYTAHRCPCIGPTVNSRGARSCSPQDSSILLMQIILHKYTQPDGYYANAGAEIGGSVWGTAMSRGNQKSPQQWAAKVTHTTKTIYVIVCVSIGTRGLRIRREPEGTMGHRIHRGPHGRPHVMAPRDPERSLRQCAHRVPLGHS